MSPKPVGSRIDEIEEAEGVTYQWDRPDPKILRWLITGVAVVQISVFFGFAIPEMIGQGQQQRAAPAEIGESLREPEGEWLATVIQEWQNKKG